MTLLGRALLSRGHKVALFGVADVESFARSCELDFRVLGADEYPVGSVEASVKVLGTLKGIQALRYTVDGGRQLADITCRFAPAQVKDSGIELMVVDQNDPAAGSVAEHVKLPFLNLLNLPLNFDPYVPPPFTGWAYQRSAWSRIRNRAAYHIFYWILSPVTKVINQHRKAWGLRELSTPEDSFSKIGQICQMTADFDFPRQAPANFHYTGPLFDETQSTQESSVEGLNGRPLVYASLGTLQNRDFSVYRHIAAACVGLDVQLVISLGGGGHANNLGALPGDPIVMDYAPQCEVLKKATLVITHAGLNTVQEALRFGVPMVAIPVTNDQPAVAARLQHCGAAEVLPAAKLNPKKLRQAIVKVLGESSFRKAALKQGDSLLKASGVGRAAELVESALVESRAHRSLAARA
jgi:zeaxanthin glucosyltransferase